MKRRQFIFTGAMAAVGMAMPTEAQGAKNNQMRKTPKGSAFSVWQIPSHSNTIGNSYVFQTKTGKVIVMDGGYPEEAYTLRGFIGALGNEVEAWFISHPHDDHMGALWEILKQGTQDLRIKAIYHSRITDKVIDAEPTEAEKTRDFYDKLSKCEAKVVDIQQPGQVFDFDGMKLKIVSVATQLTVNPYNNNSMIMRVWDKRKSLVFLGDAGVECGNLALKGPYAEDLNCDYLQMAHHGQNGCSEEFYRSISFRACLWPTPMWVWNNDTGKGFDTANLTTVRTREWMDKKGIKEHHVSVRDGLWRLD
jgi:beta-lactamase superfamily II metal-dependent hydrolase